MVFNTQFVQSFWTFVENARKPVLHLIFDGSCNIRNIHEYLKVLIFIICACSFYDAHAITEMHIILSSTQKLGEEAFDSRQMLRGDRKLEVYCDIFLLSQMSNARNCKTFPILEACEIPTICYCVLLVITDRYMIMRSGDRLPGGVGVRR